MNTTPRDMETSKEKRARAREARRRHYRRDAALGFLIALVLEGTIVAADASAWAGWAGIGLSLCFLTKVGMYALLDMNDTRIARLEKEKAEVDTEIAFAENQAAQLRARIARLEGA